MVSEVKSDLVIPVSDGDARVVAQAHARFPDIKAFVAPAAASVAIASDKIATFDLAPELAIDTPPSVVVERGADVPDAIRRLGLPVVVKVPVSTASHGTYVVRTRGQAKQTAEQLPPGRILVQAFVEGTFVGATGFADGGELLEWFAFRVPPEISVAGTPAYAFSEDDPGLFAMLQAICRKLRWTGGIDLDALRGVDGRLYLLEVNPRFSGTLVFADKLGVDLPRYYADLVGGTGYPKAAPRPPSGVLFVSLAQEAALISKDPRRMHKQAAAFRKAHHFVDSAYPDDRGLVAAQARGRSGKLFSGFRPDSRKTGFRSGPIRSLNDLTRIEASLRNPQGPVLLDCKTNAAVAAPHFSEYAEREARKRT
ncbi:MAG: ATP-grasp domain-containing protein [Phycisphaeraceae bacterium]